MAQTIRTGKPDVDRTMDRIDKFVQDHRYDAILSDHDSVFNTWFAIEAIAVATPETFDARFYSYTAINCMKAQIMADPNLQKCLDWITMFRSEMGEE